MNKDFLNTIQLIIIILISFLLNTSSSLANSLESITIVDLLRKQLQNQKLEDLDRDYNCFNNIFTEELYVANKKCDRQFKNISGFQKQSNKLKETLSKELEPIKNKVNKVEANLDRFDTLQFSTTTKLNGQVIFFIADSFSKKDESKTFTGYRTRLDFNTSFTGRDLLQIRLESKDIGRLDRVTDTLLSRLSVDSSSQNGIELAEVSYTVTPVDNTTFILGTIGVGLNDIGEVLNPFSSSSKGSISRFGRRNPATLRGSGGSGFGIKQKLGEKLLVNLGHTIDSENVANPETRGGLFNSSASSIAQIVIRPQEELALALTYTHTYQRDDINLMSSVGLSKSNKPFDDNTTTSDNFGLQVNWKVSSDLEIGGWFGYTKAQQKENGDGNVTILNGALTLAFLDLFVDNNEGGIIIGVPPTIIDRDQLTPLHIEALYRIKINDRIELTPGAFVILNPDTNNSNTIWVGAIRTLFSF